MLGKYAEALVAMRAVGDRIGEAYILGSLAKFRIDQGEFDVAKGMLDDALIICKESALLIVRDIGDRIGEVYALYGLGTLRYGEAAWTVPRPS
jgi:hypothetical protein